MSKPNYNVGALNKMTGERSNKVGVAWSMDNDRVRIKIDPFIYLRGGDDLILTLFPINDTEQVTERVNHKYDDDEIPF